MTTTSGPQRSGSSPTIAELRARSQGTGVLDRRSGEHWIGLLYMRRISPYATRWFLRLGVPPNPITGLMLLFGIGGGVVLLWPGLPGAILCVLLIQIYSLLDCSDGEVARWTGRTSAAGIYLDRVGHYLSEAALLVGLGFRAGDNTIGGYAVLGLAAALGAVLIKAETDLVDVARARHGLGKATDADAVPRSGGMALARRAAMLLRFHRIILAFELSVLVLLAAIVDAVRHDLAATRVLTVVCVVVAGVQTVLHLVSIMVSKRLA